MRHGTSLPDRVLVSSWTSDRRGPCSSVPMCSCAAQEGEPQQMFTNPKLPRTREFLSRYLED